MTYQHDEPFKWKLEQLALETVTIAVTTASILEHFDPGREVIIELVVSEYLSAGVLSQDYEEEVLHPVVYFSKQTQWWNRVTVYTTPKLWQSVTPLGLVTVPESWTTTCSCCHWVLHYGSPIID